METAFKTWDNPNEALEEVERRIHDGVPLDKLRDRAQAYVNALCAYFPWTLPNPGSVILEIGSGVGYIIEAIFQRFQPHKIIGLDISPSMIEKAKERMHRDGVDSSTIQFLTYDGIHIPASDDTIDYVYSVACLQHIPKAFVYNLFGEVLRILKPSGYAALHFIAFSYLQEQNKQLPFRKEIKKQLANMEGHWHFYYSKDELFYVISEGYGGSHIHICEENGSIWTSFGKDKDRVKY
jgi:ubiquinone/menaquinone biosynthesis C-methylase UbiE